jgi:CRISPR-associated endoribonuclease Cas6
VAVPRIILRVRARADTAYDLDYQAPLRARIYGALEGTEYGHRHDTADPPGFVTSSIMPFGDLEEGETRTLIISAAERDLLQYVITDLGANRKLDLGELPLEVDRAWIKDVDVGGLGCAGTIQTRTGVLVSIPPWDFEHYGIEADVRNPEQPEFWRPWIGTHVLRERIERNLAWKYDLFLANESGEAATGTESESKSEGKGIAPDGGSSEEGDIDTSESAARGLALDGPLFDSIEPFDEPTYITDLTVTRSPDRTQTLVLSKHDFRYRVRNDRHRSLLNLALDVGIGARNPLGLGFLDLVDTDGRNNAGS